MSIKLDPTTTEAYQSLFSKLENPDIAYQNFVARLAKYHFQVKAIIQGIYKIDCDCGLSYIGQTKRNIETRVKEHIADVKHRRSTKSAVAEHSEEGSKHYLRFDKPQILAKEHRFLPRMIREPIEIKKHPNFNREDGWKLAQAWDPIIHLVKSEPKTPTARPQDTDILECRDSMETLNGLNEKGRAKISQIREEMEALELYGKDNCDPKYDVEVEAQRHQLANLLKEFKEANISSLFAIEKVQREELLKKGDGEESSLRQRKKKVDRDELLKMSSGVTEQLLSISRQLADTTQRSQVTLDNLVSSSSTVHGTQSELQHTASSISQSSKLLSKYGRREFTDKVIMFFAFLLFLAVCLYIVQKRLF